MKLVLNEGQNFGILVNRFKQSCLLKYEIAQTINLRLFFNLPRKFVFKQHLQIQKK